MSKKGGKEGGGMDKEKELGKLYKVGRTQEHRMFLLLLISRSWTLSDRVMTSIRSKRTGRRLSR